MLEAQASPVTTWCVCVCVCVRARARLYACSYVCVSVRACPWARVCLHACLGELCMRVWANSESALSSLKPFTALLQWTLFPLKGLRQGVDCPPSTEQRGCTHPPRDSGELYCAKGTRIGVYLEYGEGAWDIALSLLSSLSSTVHLKHGEVGARERAEVVGVGVGEEVEGDDGEDGHNNGHDKEGVGHCEEYIYI